MISILFAARDSIYKTFPDLDVWDEDRNALDWPGGNRIIAHPPCRLWSMLRYFSNAPIEEKQLAIWAVEQCRQWGGILEHPAFSKLWPTLYLPRPGKSDKYGFTFGIDQHWFGHPSRKRTWLYICQIEPKNLPPIPFRLADYQNVFTGHGRKATAKKRKFCSGTPVEFAQWLLEAVKN